MNQSTDKEQRLKELYRDIWNFMTFDGPSYQSLALKVWLDEGNQEVMVKEISNEDFYTS